MSTWDDVKTAAPDLAKRVQDRFEATGYDPSDAGDYHLFRLDVTEVAFLSIAPQRDAMLIERWSPGRPVETVRRT
jgi:hypothetical protein